MALIQPTRFPQQITVRDPNRPPTIREIGGIMSDKAAVMGMPIQLTRIVVVGPKDRPKGYEWHYNLIGATRLASLQAAASDLAVAAGLWAVRLTRTETGVKAVYAKAENVQPSYDRLLAAVKAASSAKDNAGLYRPFFGIGITSEDKPLVASLDTSRACHVGVFSRTQSGKTNLMMVAISTLCEVVPPSKLGIVVIDYKSNTDFASHIGKHVVAHATNATQWVAALRNVKRVIDERSKDLTAVPNLPRIVICCDEVGEVIRSGGPEVSEHFQSIARLGAGLKVHLFVASQRPSSKEMEAILKSQLAFRIVGGVSSKIEANLCANAKGTNAEAIRRVGQFVAVGADAAGGHVDVYVPKMSPERRYSVSESDFAHVRASAAEASQTMPDLPTVPDTQPDAVNSQTVVATPTPAQTTTTEVTEADDLFSDVSVNEEAAIVADMAARITFVLLTVPGARGVSENELCRQCKITTQSGKVIERVGGSLFQPRWKLALKIAKESIDDLSKAT